MLLQCLIIVVSVRVLVTRWPRHRENREFRHQFFQTGKTQGVKVQHRENFDNTGNFPNFPKI